MKKILSILFVITYSSVVLGQEKSKKIFLKLYNQSSYSKVESRTKINNVEYVSTQKNIIISEPKFAILFVTQKGNSHEFELNKLDFGFNNEQNKTIDSNSSYISGGQETINLNLSFRYEFTPSRLKINANKKGNFTLSYGIQPYLYNSKITPLISTYYPISNTTIGGTGYIAPRYTYQISEKLFFDINAPVNLLEAKIKFTKLDDPTLNPSDRKSNSIDFNVFPVNFNLRFGISYRI